MNPSLDKSSAAINPVSNKFYFLVANGQFNFLIDISSRKTLLGCFSPHTEFVFTFKHKMRCANLCKKELI